MPHRAPVARHDCSRRTRNVFGNGTGGRSEASSTSHVKHGIIVLGKLWSEVNGLRASFAGLIVALKGAHVVCSETLSRACRVLLVCRLGSNVASRMGACNENRAIGGVRTGCSRSVVPVGSGGRPRAKSRFGSAGRAGIWKPAAGRKDDRCWRQRAEGRARGRGRRHKDRSYRAGNLQSAERVVAGVLQRDPAGKARHAISRRAYQFLVTSTGSAIGAAATTATGGGTALRWNSSSRMNAAPAAVSLNSQRLFFTPSKMRE